MLWSVLVMVRFVYDPFWLGDETSGSDWIVHRSGWSPLTKMSFCEKTTKLLQCTRIQRSFSNSIFASSTVACRNLLCRHECHTSKIPNYRTLSTTKQTRIRLSNNNLRQLNLTNFPKTAGSNILKILETNLRTIIVKTFIDKTFSKKEFLEGAKQVCP